MMKRILPIILVGFLVFSCAQKEKSAKLEKGTDLYQLAQELSQQIPILDPEKNTVIVTTKKFDITVGDVFTTLHQLYGDGIQQLKSLDTNQLTEIIKGNAIALAEKKLLLQAAEKNGIKISDAEVDSILELQYMQVGGKEKFLNYLSNANINFKALREDIRDNLAINSYLDKMIMDSVNITAEDIQRYYNETDQTATVRHILKITQGKSPEEKAQIHSEMEGILDRAQKGENFESLAKKYSDDPGSKDNGGLYKDFGRGEMVKPFEDAAFDLPIGSISDIVESPYGYHIIKVIDRKKESRPLDTVRSEIENILINSRQNELLINLLDNLKKENDFKVVIP